MTKGRAYQPGGSYHILYVDYPDPCIMIADAAIELVVMAPGLSPQAVSKPIKLMTFVAFQKQSYRWGFTDPLSSPPDLVNLMAFRSEH